MLEAVILGLVQGLTEFLPVSSSGHLVLAPELLGIPQPTLAFDVMLHLATLLAVAGYFARDIFAMILSFVAPRRLAAGEVKGWRRLTLWLVVGTVPAGLAGVLLGDFFESLFDSTLAVGVFLLVTAVLLTLADLVADRTPKRLLKNDASPREYTGYAQGKDAGSARSGATGATENDAWRRPVRSRGRGFVLQQPATTRKMGDMGLVDALIVGGFQALAIAPGLSRSGATIAGGTYLGLERTAAARFSFLLSVPVIAGAGLLKVGDITAGFEGSTGVYVAGAVAALVSGVMAVHFMLRYLRGHRFRVFAIYTAALGAIVVGLSLL